VSEPTESHAVPAWRRRTEGESRWPAILISVLLSTLTLAIPSMAVGPRWLAPSVLLAVLNVIVVVDPTRMSNLNPRLRILDLTLVAIAGVVVALSIGKVLHELWTEPEGVTRYLLLTGGAILVADILFFALWYWQIDRGGPAARALGLRQYPEILFPQMSDPALNDPVWEPRLGDYVYLSFTIAVGFGPADTVPLIRNVKYAMLLQAASSLTIVTVVVSSAVSALAD
jgi:uncharacterized membrane protein